MEPTAEPTAADPAMEAEAVEQAFSEGFGASSPTAGATPSPATEVPAGGRAQAAVPVAEPTPETTSPEYAQVTKEEAESFRRAVGDVKDLRAMVEKQFGTAFGNLGGLKRAIDQLQAMTPTGQPLSVSDEDFAELKEEFPDLTALTVKGLNRVLGKLKGSGPPASAASALPPEVAEEIVAKAAAQADQKTAVRLLSWFRPDWREVVGSPSDTTAYRAWLGTLAPERQIELLDTWDATVIHDSIEEFVEAQQTAMEGLRPGWQEIVGEDGSDTPYRQWLATQPEAYQARIRETWDPTALADSLARFQTQSHPAPVPPPAGTSATPVPHPQRARVAAAVQPRGAGAPAPSGAEKTESEAFEEAFRS